MAGNDNNIILGGGIDGNLGEHDYEGGGSLSSIKKPEKTWFDSRYEARQGNSECVMFGIMGCIVDNTGYDFTDGDIVTLRKMLPDYGRDVKRGMYTTKGADMFVDFFKTKGLNLVKNRVDTYGPDYMDYLKAGRTLTLGSDISAQYIEDLQADGDIDILFGGSTGHIRRIIYNPTTDNYYIIENFLGSLKHNVIEITDLELRDQLAHKTLHYSSFYFYFENYIDMPQHNLGTTQAEKEIVKAWEKCIQEGYKPSFVNYVDEFYITRMLIDIDNHRKNS